MATAKTSVKNIKPTTGYALIEPLEAQKQTAAGIVLPDTHDEKSQQGKVIAMGKAPVNKAGKVVTPEFKADDTVIYKKWGGDEVKLDITGMEYTFVKFEDILAVIQ